MSENAVKHKIPLFVTAIAQSHITFIMFSSVLQHCAKQMQWKTWKKPSEPPAFYCMFRMLTSVIATDYNRVVCIRQTRNDEEVTDWWKWWATIFLSKKRQEKETTEYIFKEIKKKERKAAAGWEHRDSSNVAPPSLSPLIPSSLPPSLPPPPSGKNQSVVWEEKEGDGMTAGWMVDDGWNHGILARVPACEVGGSDATWPQFAGH